MSAQVKKAGRIGTKIVAALLFVFFVMFNVQIGMHDGETRDINLFGLKISIFIPNAMATNDFAKEPSEQIETWTICKNTEPWICRQN